MILYLLTWPIFCTLPALLVLPEFWSVETILTAAIFHQQQRDECVRSGPADDATGASLLYHLLLPDPAI